MKVLGLLGFMKMTSVMVWNKSAEELYRGSYIDMIAQDIDLVEATCGVLYSNSPVSGNSGTGQIALK